MDDRDRDLEGRLAGYRPVVERAIARRPLKAGGSRDGRRWLVTAVAAGTVAAGVLGWIALSSGDEPTSSGEAGTTSEHLVAPASTTAVDVSATTCIPASPDSADGGFCVTGATWLSVEGLEAVAVGDSVMLGAASTLATAGLAVNGLESRQFSELVPMLPDIAETGTSDAVVIHVGNNGTIDPGDLDAVMDALAGVRRVVVLSIDIDRAWASPNNELIRALPARYANVIVLDWDALAPSCDDWADANDRVGDCFASDGFDLSDIGADYYTALIVNVLDLA